MSVNNVYIVTLIGGARLKATYKIKFLNTF